MTLVSLVSREALLDPRPRYFCRLTHQNTGEKFQRMSLLRGVFQQRHVGGRLLNSSIKAATGLASAQTFSTTPASTGGNIKYFKVRLD